MEDFSDQEREDFARQWGVHVHRTRRSPPRLPVGALRLRGKGVDGCIPLVTGDLLTERDKGYFKLLQGELVNVIRYGAEDNLLVPSESLEALRATAPAVFGCELNVALWLVPFRVELEASRSKRLALETREGDPSTTDLRPLVEEVIARTRRSVQRLAPSVDLPSWLSPSLVELIVRRCSYSGGGGAGALTIESIFCLLANPRRLSKYLRAIPGLARHFAKELSLLDAFPAARKQPRARRKRARADVIDMEHATAVERSAALAACSTRSSLATIGSRTNVVFENGFVGLRSGFNTPEGFDPLDGS